MSTSSSAHSSDNLDITKLTEAVSRTRSFADHIALVDALYKRDDLDALRKARKSFARSHPLPESIWLQWISDEQQLAVTLEEQTNLLDLASQAVFDCPTVALCNLRLKLNASLCETHHPKANLATAFNDALWLGAAAHFTEGHSIWKDYCPAHSPENIPPQPPLDVHDSDQARECRIFEERLKAALNEEYSSNEDYIVSVFLSYASYATQVDIHSAISIYERCVQLYKVNHMVWSAYCNFCVSSADSDRRYYTARRAARACSDNLKMWTFVTREMVNATSRFVPNRLQALDELIDTVRPFVMRSDKLREASHLCISIWTVFQALGAPKEALSLVKSTLPFNVSGTTEWASALCFAAGVCMKNTYRDDSANLFEQVVAERGQEARWWLAYAACIGQLAPDAAADIFSRASVAVSEGVYVDIIEDSWLAFEVKRGSEQFAERVSNVLFAMEKRRAIVNNETFEEAPKSKEKRQKRQGSSGKQDAKRPRREDNRKEFSNGVKRPTVDMETENVNEQLEDVSKEAEKPKNAKSDEKDDEKDVLMSENREQVLDKDESVKGSRNRHTSKEQDTYEGEVEPRTIYLNNIPFQAREKDVRDAFEFAGKIVDVRLPRRSDGASKGIAYVEFEEDASVDRCIENRNVAILGRSVWVRRSQPRPRKGKQRDHGVARGKLRKANARTSRPERIRLDEDHGNEETKLENNDDVQSKTQEDFRAMFLGTGKKQR